MKKTTSYHHGNLKQTVMNAARAFVKEHGIEKLSIRQVAKQAGVSPGAPYHHFKDKQELIAALANETLQHLDQCSQQALQSQNDPQKKLEALGLNYVLYAIENPDEFKLMFGAQPPSILEQKDPKQAPVFRILVNLMQEFELKKEDYMTSAISAWSLVHGLAILLIDGPLKPLTQDKKQVEQLAQQVLSKLKLPTK